MLSIDRVRVNAFGLFGLTAKADPSPEPRSPDAPGQSGDLGQSGSSTTRSDPLAPVFEAVHTALKDAGHLDA